MKYKYDKDVLVKSPFNLLNVSKGIFLIFLLYMHWYKEIWGDISIVLYGSVVLLTVSLFLPFGDNRKSYLDFGCMTNFYIILLAFGIYCFATGLIVSINRSLFLSSMVTYFSFLVVLFDCCLISKRSGGWEWLLDMLIIVALVCFIYTIFFGVNRLSGGATVTVLSISNNPHSLALVFIIGLFAVIGRDQFGFEYFPIKMMVVLLLMYGILITGSRKTLISAVILLCIWIYSVLQFIGTTASNTRRNTIIICIFLLVIFIVWYYIFHFVGTEQFERFVHLFIGEDDSSNESRVQMYISAWNIWKEHPIFGVGFNQYRLHAFYGGYSHSTYAEVLSCTGLMGTLILFVPILGYIFRIIRYALWRNSRFRYYYMICLAGVIVELFQGLGQIWIYGFAHQLFYLIIFGVFEYWVSLESQFNPIQNGGKQRCKYLH